MGSHRKKRVLVAAVPPHKVRGKSESMLRFANSLLALFAVAVPAMAQRLDEMPTLSKSRLRPVHFIACVSVLWPMTINRYIDRYHRRKGEPQ